MTNECRKLRNSLLNVFPQEMGLNMEERRHIEENRKRGEQGRSTGGARINQECKTMYGTSARANISG